MELIDYCYRKFIYLTNWAEKNENRIKDDDAKKILERTHEEDIRLQMEEIEFSCAISCFSLIRFISDYMQELSIPICHQMIENNDIPCILVPLIELKPWLRKNKKGEIEKFED